MTSAPIVSIVVPAFNEEAAVVKASFESLCAQTFTDFECIVIDESTVRERAEACQELCLRDGRFTYIHPPQRIGLSRSLNLGIEHARGRFIARFDSDDVCMPERLALQVAFLRHNPDISVVGGALEIVDDNDVSTGFRTYPQQPDAIARGMHFTTTIAHPTVMFRRDVIYAHGGYNPEFRFSEDLDLWLRWLNAGVVFANLPQTLVRYRQKATRRDTRHWRYNIRARVHNFQARQALWRAAGIACIATWASLPNAVQEVAFRAVLLRTGRREETK